MHKTNKLPFSALSLLISLIILFTGCSISPIGDSSPPTETTLNIDTMASTVSATAPPTENTTTKESTTSSAPATTTPSPGSTFSIHFIDVGQADAALVECDGHYMLIDGGNKADSSTIYSVLKNAAVPKLDIVIGTHGHEDHIGGLAGALNYTSADLVLCPVNHYDSDAFADFKKYATQKGGGITIPSVNDTYSLGSATIKILGVNGGSGANNSSIILRIDYGKTSFLFTGDAEREAEESILNKVKPDLKATVLKIGHHGSDTSTTYRLLRAVMPQFAVISVGKDNNYGHPTEDTLSKLRDAEVTTFRTDMQGDIRCISDGEFVTFHVERNAEADTLGITQTLEARLEAVVKEACENYNVKTGKLLTGTLTYTINSSTKVDLLYEVDAEITPATEQLVDDTLDEILKFVIEKIEAEKLPEAINVYATANYTLTNDTTSNENPLPPQSGTDYIGNKNTKKFHYPWCGSVSQMKESNKYYFTGMRSEMINQGYDPCKKCTP